MSNIEVKIQKSDNVYPKEVNAEVTETETTNYNLGRPDQCRGKLRIEKRISTAIALALETPPAIILVDGSLRLFTTFPSVQTATSLAEIASSMIFTGFLTYYWTRDRKIFNAIDDKLIPLQNNATDASNKSFNETFFADLNKS